MGGQHFDVDEDKHTLVLSQTGLKFHQSWLVGPPFIDDLAANYLGSEVSEQSSSNHHVQR